jgi:hypothetical protein
MHQQTEPLTYGGDAWGGDGGEGISISAKTIKAWIKFLSLAALIATLAICVATLIFVKDIRSKQSTAVLVSNVFENLEEAITDLVASYFGIGCIRIRPTDLPYIVPFSNRCYRITGNYTLNSTPVGNRLIQAIGKTDIRIDGGGYTFTVNAHHPRSGFRTR